MESSDLSLVTYFLTNESARALAWTTRQWCPCNVPALMKGYSARENARSEPVLNAGQLELLCCIQLARNWRVVTGHLAQDGHFTHRPVRWWAEPRRATRRIHTSTRVSLPFGPSKRWEQLPHPLVSLSSESQDRRLCSFHNLHRASHTNTNSTPTLPTPNN